MDHFKKVNDTHGHEIGDEVLRMVARTLGGNLRSVDSFGRWGGEEFIAVITNTSREYLCMVAERSRRLVAESELRAGPHHVRVTVSIGATMAHAGDTIESLVDRADGLLYRAKASGRNRVKFEKSPDAA